MKIKRDDPEHRLQVAFFQYLNIAYPEVNEHAFAIPNGGARNKTVATKLKAEGVKKGIPDIFIAIPFNDFHGLFIELKIKPNGPTAEQKDWIAKLKAQGYDCHVCYTLDEAIDCVKAYFKA